MKPHCFLFLYFLFPSQQATRCATWAITSVSFLTVGLRSCNWRWVRLWLVVRVYLWMFPLSSFFFFCVGLFFSSSFLWTAALWNFEVGFTAAWHWDSPSPCQSQGKLFVCVKPSVSNLLPVGFYVSSLCWSATCWDSMTHNHYFEGSSTLYLWLTYLSVSLRHETHTHTTPAIFFAFSVNLPVYLFTHLSVCPPVDLGSLAYWSISQSLSGRVCLPALSLHVVLFSFSLLLPWPFATDSTFPNTSPFHMQHKLSTFPNVSLANHTRVYFNFRYPLQLRCLWTFLLTVAPLAGLLRCLRCRVSSRSFTSTICKFGRESRRRVCCVLLGLFTCKFEESGSNGFMV